MLVSLTNERWQAKTLHTFNYNQAGSIFNFVLTTGSPDLGQFARKFGKFQDTSGLITPSNTEDIDFPSLSLSIRDLI